MPATPHSGWLPLAFLLLAAVGLGVAAELTVIHVRVHERSGEAFRSFCSISASVNCDTVARSPYSVLLGVPVSVWGLAGYLAMAILAATGLSRSARAGGWPAGFLVLLSGAAVLASVVLAAVSKLILHSWCILCMAAWTVNIALFAVALLLGRRAGGAGQAIRSDLIAAARRPVVAGAALVLAAMGVAVLWTTYPRYWQAPAVGPSGLLVGVDRDGLPWIGADRPAMTVIEFTAPGCAGCERAHRQLRALLRSYGGELRLVHRTFPDDPACNPSIGVVGRRGSCQMAAAAICAEPQGKFWEMSEAMYRSEGAPNLRAWAVRLGLDVDRFEDCLGSRDTARRIAEDIEAARRAGVKQPPAFLVDGRLYGDAVPIDVIARRLGRAAGSAPHWIVGGSQAPTADPGR